MKKRYLLFLIPVIAICICLLHFKRVNISTATSAEIVYIYNNINIEQVLESDELELIISILDNKRSYCDNLSCGFSDEICLRFDDSNTFCIACDTCPVIYWKNADRYINLTDDEQKKLYSLMQSYGADFPCL